MNYILMSVWGLNDLKWIKISGDTFLVNPNYLAEFISYFGVKEISC